MDKEAIEKRLAELQAQFSQVEAQGNALIGAIEDCKYWLVYLENKKAEPEPEKQV